MDHKQPTLHEPSLWVENKQPTLHGLSLWVGFCVRHCGRFTQTDFIGGVWILPYQLPTGEPGCRVGMQTDHMFPRRVRGEGEAAVRCIGLEKSIKQPLKYSNTFNSKYQQVTYSE